MYEDNKSSDMRKLVDTTPLAPESMSHIFPKLI